MKFKAAIIFLATINLAPMMAFGAPRPAVDKAKKVARLIERLSKNPNAPILAQKLRVLGDKSAIPALKEAFATAGSTQAKMACAIALVGLGADGAYWDFLEKPAVEAVDSGIPFPLDYRQGAYSKEFSKEFTDWSASKGLPNEVAARLALKVYPMNVMSLAMTGDKRAIPILMKGVKSKNSLIRTHAAKGLAKLKHEPAIDEIYQACKKDGVECDGPAEALVFFRTKKADDKAQELSGWDARRLEKVRKKAQSTGDDSLFGDDAVKKSVESDND